MKRFLIPLSLFAGIVGFLGMGLTLNPREVPSPLIGKPAPDFILPQVQDQQSTFSPRRLAGQVWLLNIWASWCGGCKQEHPLLMEVSQNGSVPIYGMDYKDRRIEALAWLAREGNPYPVSAMDETGRIGIDYGVYGVPETFVIDKQGVIRYKQIGPLDRETLDRTIMPLIKRLQQE